MTAVSQVSRPALSQELTPHEIRPGLYGTTFYDHGETLFLRMELITEANARNWARFQDITGWISEASTGGLLGRLVELAGAENTTKKPFTWRMFCHKQ